MWIYKEIIAKKKVYGINVVLISLIIISIVIAGIIMVLPWLKKTEAELAKQQTESIKQNYASEETSTQQWDISSTENDHVIATLSSDGVLTISGTGKMKYEERSLFIAMVL